MEPKDIICPSCGARHGPAAETCECGRSLIVEEEPAPPLAFFAAGVFFAVVAAISARVASEGGFVYFPLGGILFASVAFTLGVRSWLWQWRHRRRP